MPVDTLVPRLWSEGISRATGQAVALTTTQFVPDDRWLDRLNAVDLDRWAGVGGPIDNDPQASALNWAIFFLRYSAFAPPLPAGETGEIAADNAVYDREAILSTRTCLTKVSGSRLSIAGFALQVKRSRSIRDDRRAPWLRAR